MTRDDDQLPSDESVDRELDHVAEIAVDAELDRALLAELAEPVIAVDNDGRIVRVNREAEILLGYPRLELLGKPVEILVPELARSRHGEHRRGYMTYPQPRQMGSAKGLDLVIVTKFGAHLPVSISLKPLLVSSGRYVSAVIRLKTEVRG